MVVKETLGLIFVNYWSQIVLMGGGFLYIFKNYFERRSKLIELKSSILIQNNIDQLNILDKKYCEISMHFEEILISKYESSKQDEVTDNDTIKPDSIKSNFKEFIKLFRQVILFSKISKHDIISSDFEYQFSSYIKLFCNVYQDENLYKTHKLKLILNKQSLDFKFNEVLFKYLK